MTAAHANSFDSGAKMRSIGCLLLPLLFISAASAQSAPDGLQFNVPYVCSDGQTYVVHRCATGPKGEFCYYQAEGQSERYNTRAAVAYQMTKMCRVKAASGAAAAQASSDLQLDTPYQCAGGLILTAFQCQRAQRQEYCFVRAEQNGKFLTQVPKPRSEIVSQFKACRAGTPFNPPYIAEFPSAYRVVQGMNVGNPAENVRRAIGAFYQLSEIVKVLAGQRSFTSDEQKLLNDYTRISGVLAQGAAQKFPSEQFNPAANPYRYSPSDPKFGFEGIPVWATFLSPSIQTQFAQLISSSNRSYRQAVAQERQKAFQQVQSDAEAQQTEASLAKDPGSVAGRKCLESGRGELECLPEAMKVGVNDLTGGDLLKGIMPETPVGLRLSGVYNSGSTTFLFEQGYVKFGCGSLNRDIHMYSVESNGAQVRVTVGNSPKPLVLSYKDGKLIGPGPVVVTGQVPAGRPVAHTTTTYDTQTQTTTTQKQIDAGEAAQYTADQVHQNGMEYSVDQQTTTTTTAPRTFTRQEVPMMAKTEHCSIGVVPATGQIPSMATALTPLVGAKSSQSANTAPGLRLNGTYAAPGGLKIEFREDSATLECGEALSAEAYSVLPEGGQLVVKFDNKMGPFALALQPNGTLAGSGSINVAGRQVIQSGNGEIAYRPRNARCSVGTLTVQAAH